MSRIDKIRKRLGEASSEEILDYSRDFLERCLNVPCVIKHRSFSSRVRDMIHKVSEQSPVRCKRAYHRNLLFAVRNILVEMSRALREGREWGIDEACVVLHDECNHRLEFNAPSYIGQTRSSWIVEIIRSFVRPEVKSYKEAQGLSSAQKRKIDVFA